jgi:Mrp family chromosome partitioning ATPase
VMSGKGGVGKSLVASLLATALAREGRDVGILDADITGPSIPKMFGLNARPSGSELGILPILSRSGIEVMSMNFLLPSEDEAVIWRGPLMSKAITQFWEEVLWGKLDYLIIDLPPGTGDAPLTVMQIVALSGVIAVFTPQDLTEMIVTKAVRMAQKMNVRVLGVVENMSYLLLPQTGEKLEVFGRSKGKDMARISGAPLLGSLPIDPELARLCDEGEIEKYSSDAVSEIVANLAAVLDEKR